MVMPFPSLENRIWVGLVGCSNSVQIWDMLLCFFGQIWQKMLVWNWQLRSRVLFVDHCQCWEFICQVPWEETLFYALERMYSDLPPEDSRVTEMRVWIWTVQVWLAYPSSKDNAEALLAVCFSCFGGMIRGEKGIRTVSRFSYLKVDPFCPRYSWSLLWKPDTFFRESHIQGILSTTTTSIDIIGNSE